MKKLTKFEEDIMQYFWEYGPSKVTEIIERIPSPKPAMTTVSTIVRILEEKGFVGHEKEGRGYRYHSVLSKEEYRRFSLKSLVSRYFGGSPQALLSHLVESEEIKEEELNSLLEAIKSQKNDDTH